MDVRDKKVAAINDERISQRHYTTTQTPPGIRTERRGLIDSSILYQTIMADRLYAKRLKYDGTVTPKLY
jgi:hypothetical protein